MMIDILGHIKDPSAHHKAVEEGCYLRFVDHSNVFGGPGCGESVVSNTSYNVGLGDEALYSLNGGSRNVAVGPGAGYYISTASRNVLMGDSAGWDIITGHANSLVGDSAGYQVVNSSHNAGLGDNSLGGLSTASWPKAGYNSGLGENSLGGIETGDGNTGLGHCSGQGATGASSDNVFIGEYSGPSSEEVNFLLYIAAASGIPLIGGDLYNERVGINVDPASLTNILEIEEASDTDPIADSWTTYASDRQHKKIIGQEPKLLDLFRNVKIYRYTRKPAIHDSKVRDVVHKEARIEIEQFGYDHRQVRLFDIGQLSHFQDEEKLKNELLSKKAALPKYTTERIGISIDDPETPEEILARNGDQTGIDLLAYIGWLHGVVKELTEKVDRLELQVV